MFIALINHHTRFICFIVFTNGSLDTHKTDELHKRFKAFVTNDKAPGVKKANPDPKIKVRDIREFQSKNPEFNHHKTENLPRNYKNRVSEFLVAQELEGQRGKYIHKFCTI